MLRSSAGALWVSAPTDNALTQVSAIALAVGRVIVPDASSTTLGVVAGWRWAMTSRSCGIDVLSSMILSAPGRSAWHDSSRVCDFDFDGDAVSAACHRRARGADGGGGGDLTTAPDSVLGLAWRGSPSSLDLLVRAGGVPAVSCVCARSPPL